MKTLKDIEDILDDIMPYGESSEGYERELTRHIRQAVKEWIEYIDDRDTLYSGHIVLINWIKEFFNLEEDE